MEMINGSFRKAFPMVLKLIHDHPAAGHPGRDRILAAARRVYFWPRVQADVEGHVGRCVSCTKHKGNPSGPAPMLEYPPPMQPWDVVSIDLLQLPKSHQGSQYLLVCVDHFSRYVVLAPLKSKTVSAIAHALVTRLICQYTTPHVLLSDNGTEFCHQLVRDLLSVRNKANLHCGLSPEFKWASGKSKPKDFGCSKAGSVQPV